MKRLQAMGFCLGLYWIAVPVQAQVLNRIVAVVNDEILTEADVESRMSVFVDGVPESAKGLSVEQMRGAVLVRMIEERLMHQEAKRLGVTVDAEEVAAQLEEMRRSIGSEEKMRQVLADVGLSKEGLKQQLREQLMVKKIIGGMVRANIVITPHEVAKELRVHPEARENEQLVEVHHLLVRVNGERTEQEARKKIEEIHQALLEDADFDELARQYSEDPNAAEGGAMGWVGPGILLPELDAVIFNLDEGNTSMPVRTALGFHLVKVGGRRTVSSVSANEQKRLIERRLYDEKFDHEFRTWIDGLKKDAYIDIRVGH